ncbi:MAG: hypothetical protein Q7U51_14800 [Methanoregula sp.]|nr:hypothetical protein [Methanoregula sp.]
MRFGIVNLMGDSDNKITGILVIGHCCIGWWVSKSAPAQHRKADQCQNECPYD